MFGFNCNKQKAKIAELEATIAYQNNKIEMFEFSDSQTRKTKSRKTSSYNNGFDSSSDNLSPSLYDLSSSGSSSSSSSSDSSSSSSSSSD